MKLPGQPNVQCIISGNEEDKCLILLMISYHFSINIFLTALHIFTNFCWELKTICSSQALCHFEDLCQWQWLRAQFQYQLADFSTGSNSIEIYLCSFAVWYNAPPTYHDGTSVYSFIWMTDGEGDRTCDSWFTGREPNLCCTTTALLFWDWKQTAK